MRERKWRSRRRDFRQRRRRDKQRPADIDAVVEVQLSHHFQERSNRLQVSLLQRNVGAAQRLGQSRDLEARVVLRRIEPPLRQGLTDRAPNRRRARLRMARNLLNAVARYEQVEICLSPLDQGFAEVLPEARLCARSEVGFGSSDMSALGFFNPDQMIPLFPFFSKKILALIALTVDLVRLVRIEGAIR